MYYSTSFSGTENPISESGNWINGLVVGLDWQDVQKTPGLAFGDAATPSGYSDPTAIVAGAWGPNHYVETVIYNNISGGDVGEFEIRLRTTITAHSITGYELLWDSSGTFQLVRWNGPVEDFTLLSGTLHSAFGSPVTGDVFKGDVGSDNQIRIYKNGVLKYTGDADSTYTTGSPGIGFFRRSGAMSDFGFSSFLASDGTLLNTLKKSGMLSFFLQRTK